MVIKQGILKGEKIKFVFIITILPLSCLVFALMVFLFGSDRHSFLAVLSGFMGLGFPFFLIECVLALTYLEWFYIYGDRIEVRGILGVKNVVYYKDVTIVEETEIPLTSRSYFTPFFIFHDGRKQNHKWASRPSCYNKRRYSLKIYKTDELESFIRYTLCLEIKNFNR